MAEVTLPFGKEKMKVTIPDNRLNGILVSKAHEFQADKPEEEIVKDALAHPIHSKRLRELAKGKDNIVLIASDHTRPVPSKVIMPGVLEEIKAGNPNAKITILIATGFHRPTTREELIYKFGEDIVDREDITFAVHKSHENADMVELGTLPSGGKLKINKIAAEADLLISEGFIEPHFFCRFFRWKKKCTAGSIQCSNRHGKPLFRVYRQRVCQNRRAGRQSDPSGYDLCGRTGKTCFYHKCGTG